MKELLSEGWVGSIIGLVGIMAGLAIAYYYRARPRLASQVNSLELLGNNPVLPKEIDFLFRGQKVAKVTLSRVAIWNMGNTTLRREQIVTTDPLRIVTSNGSQILEVRVLSRTREVNDFTCATRVRAAGNEAECTFDYLDNGDGALLELIHTGDGTVQVTGTLREVPKGVLAIKVPKSTQLKQQAPATRVGAGAFETVLLLAGVGLLAALPTVPPDEFPKVLLIGPFLMLIGMIVLWSVRRIPPGQLSTQITSGPPSSRPSRYRALFGKDAGWSPALRRRDDRAVRPDLPPVSPSPHHTGKA
jgi:hypothetical protein